MESKGLKKWNQAFKEGNYSKKWSDFIYHDLLPEHLEIIYSEIKKKYREICDDSIQYWHQPKWKHMVRSALDRLFKEGRAESPNKDGYWVKLK